MKNTTISRLLLMVLSLVLSLSLFGHAYAQVIVRTDENNYPPPVTPTPVTPTPVTPTPVTPTPVTPTPVTPTPVTPTPVTPTPVTPTPVTPTPVTPTPVTPTPVPTSTTTTTVTTTTLTPVTTNTLNNLSLTPATTQVIETNSSQTPQFTPPTDTSSAAAQLHTPNHLSNMGNTTYIINHSNEPTTRFASFAEAASYVPTVTSVTAQSLQPPADPMATVSTATLASDVAALVHQGKTKAREALTIYSQHHIGQPLWQEALQLGLQAVERAPNNAEAIYFVAEIYSLTDYWALAWESWMQYFALGGKVSAETQRQIANVGIELGYLYYNEGRIIQALNIFRQVSELAPNSPNGFIWTARVLYEQGSYTGALPYWQRASLLTPDDDAVKFYLAESQARAIPAVTPEAQVQLASVPVPTTLFEQGVTNFEQGNYTVAERFFRDALQNDNNHAAAWVYLARAAVAQQNLTLAQQAIGRATLLEPANVEYRNLEVQINNLAGN